MIDFASAWSRTELDGPLDQRRERQPFFLQLEASGLDLRNIEQVVDELQQMLAARFDQRRVIGVTGIGDCPHRLAVDQRRKADDGVERRPQLVTRRREEHRFGFVRGHGLLPLADQSDDGEHVGRQKHDQRADELQRIRQRMILERAIRRRPCRRSPRSPPARPAYRPSAATCAARSTTAARPAGRKGGADIGAAQRRREEQRQADRGDPCPDREVAPARSPYVPAAIARLSRSRPSHRISAGAR